jgi:hypothetical protein
MTKKRRHSLLPRRSRRHLIGLRHTASFGSQVARSSGQLILDRSFTHLLRLRSRTGALSNCSLRSLRCSLVAAVFVGSGETDGRARLTTSHGGFPVSSCRSAARTSPADSFVAPRATHVHPRNRGVMGRWASLVAPHFLSGALRRARYGLHALAPRISPWPFAARRRQSQPTRGGSVARGAATLSRDEVWQCGDVGGG